MSCLEEYLLNLMHYYENPSTELIGKTKDELILLIADGDYSASDVMSLVSIIHKTSKYCCGKMMAAVEEWGGVYIAEDGKWWMEHDANQNERQIKQCPWCKEPL